MKPRAFAAGMAVTCLLLGATGFAAPAPMTAAPTTLGSAPAPQAGPADGPDIRDIRAPLHIPEWWRVWALAAAALVGTGLALAGVRAYRRRKRRPLLPHERALARLDQAEALAAAGRARAYAEAASEAIRAYLEERFGIHATVQTTDEFFEAVLRDRPPQLLESIDLLRIFLEACDLAKFSTLSLPKADLASLDQIARRLVLETARPATPNAEAPAGSPPARPTPTAEPTLARQS